MIRFRPITEWTPERIKWMWEQIAQLAAWTCSDDYCTIEHFLLALQRPGTRYFAILEGEQEVGYCNIHPLEAWAARVHCVFYDRKMLGRGTQLNRLVVHLMREQQLAIVEAETPASHKATLLFLKRMGWQETGRRRGMLRRNGQLEDMIYHSLTGEEAEMVYGRYVWRRETESRQQDGSRSDDTGHSQPSYEVYVDAAPAERGEAADIRAVPGVWSPSGTFFFHDAFGSETDWPA